MNSGFSTKYSRPSFVRISSGHSRIRSSNSSDSMQSLPHHSNNQLNYSWQLAPQTVAVGHGDAAGDAADDADEALVGSANEQVFEMRAAVELLFRCAVHRAVIVARVANDRGGSEHVGVDDAAAVIGDEPYGRLGDPVVPAELFETVGFFVELAPVVE